MDSPGLTWRDEVPVFQPLPRRAPVAPKGRRKVRGAGYSVTATSTTNSTSSDATNGTSNGTTTDATNSTSNGISTGTLNAVPSAEEEERIMWERVRVALRGWREAHGVYLTSEK